MGRSGLLPRGVDFADRLAPDIQTMEAISRGVLNGLPENIQAKCAGVVIRVGDFPSEEVVEDLGLETEFELLGLFVGNGLPQSGATPETGVLPNEIWLFRRPILDYWADNPDTLKAIIAHVLIHEIGHHFGLSDADMVAIEAEAG